MKSRTFHCNSVAQLVQQLPAFIDKNYRPTLAIVFSSIKRDIEGICEFHNETCSMVLLKEK